MEMIGGSLGSDTKYDVAHRDLGLVVMEIWGFGEERKMV